VGVGIGSGTVTPKLKGLAIDSCAAAMLAERFATPKRKRSGTARFGRLSHCVLTMVVAGLIEYIACDHQNKLAAKAYPKWKDRRLPSEQEWELKPLESRAQDFGSFSYNPCHL